MAKACLKKVGSSSKIAVKESGVLQKPAGNVAQVREEKQVVNAFFQCLNEFSLLLEHAEVTGGAR